MMTLAAAFACWCPPVRAVRPSRLAPSPSSAIPITARPRLRCRCRIRLVQLRREQPCRSTCVSCQSALRLVRKQRLRLQPRLQYRLSAPFELGQTDDRMRTGLSTGVLLICASVLFAGPLIGQESGVIELPVLRPLAADEAVEIQIVTGPLPRGARLEVMT